MASYTPGGAKGLLKEGGTARRAAVEKLMKSLGGRLEAFYFAFGENDAYIITEVPDNVTIAALSHGKRVRLDPYEDDCVAYS